HCTRYGLFARYVWPMQFVELFPESPIPFVVLMNRSIKSQSNQTPGLALEKILAQCRIVREARGAPERFDRFLVSIQQSQQMPTRGPEWLIADDAALRQSIECIQSGGRIACLRQRHGTSHRRADAGGHPDKAFVKQCDFLPVNVPGFDASCVNGLDCGLQLVMPGLAKPSGSPQKLFGFFH